MMILKFIILEDLLNKFHQEKSYELIIHLMQVLRKIQEGDITLTIEQLRNKWNELIPTYGQMDPCMQSFYLTLIHILRINQAKHILEIACGTGKYLINSLSLKPFECTYLASDLSPCMVNHAKSQLQGQIRKLGVQQVYEEWLKRQNISFAVLNGEEYIESSFKFDRIICNLVLHVTENSMKMLSNLFEAADSGCLLGLNVMANESAHSIVPLRDKIVKQRNLNLPKFRSPFHLDGKVAAIAEKIGWQVLAKWNQNAPIGEYERTDGIKNFARDMMLPNQTILEEIMNIVAKNYEEKKVLNFEVQMLILRKP